MTLTLRFLGAAGTVTGSRYLLEEDGLRILVDFGLFQGHKDLRLRNWAEFPFDARSVDAVVLTHAHVDHSGALPLLVRRGFAGPIHATAPTADLVRTLLLDTAKLQEQDAEYANRKRFSKHEPALPLFTIADANAALARLEKHAFDEPFPIGERLQFRLRRAGHLLGAASVHLECAGRSILFSGDVGRADGILHLPPDAPPAADVLVCESTYGDRRHEPGDPADRIAEEVRMAVARGGLLLVPAFAVGRTQEVLFHLRRLEDRKALPDVPIYVDSPMAIEATRTYLRNARELHVSPLVNFSGEEPWPRRTRFCPGMEDSRAINEIQGPAIVVSASGMAEGGRVLHHLRRRLPDPRATVLFVGFQAAGTRGRRLLEGEPEIKIHGQYVPVRAAIRFVAGLSSHADAQELEDWIASAPSPPGEVFLTHGEPQATTALVDRFRARGLRARAARDGERVVLVE